MVKCIYDPYYIKLLDKTDRGLIIGDSRALQGIDPENLSFPTFNFAFTIGHSPFDDSYIKLISKKIDRKSNTERHHLISVTPWSLLFVNNNENDINPYFSENLLCEFSNPNWEYIFKYWDLSIVTNLRLLRNKSYTTNLGWNNQNIDSIELEREYPRRVREKIENYKNKYPNRNLTLMSHRVANLQNIIRELKKTGRVTLLRLPVSMEMYEFEQESFPNFTEIIKKVVKETNTTYVDLTDIRVQTTDGNHIWDKEVPRIMKELDTRLANAL